MSAVVTFRDVCYSGMILDFSCEIEAGTRVLIITGCEEESTALTRLMSGCIMPDQGSIHIFGASTAEMNPEKLLSMRLELGIVPFNGGLVSNLKLWENVFLPFYYHKGKSGESNDNSAKHFLNSLGCHEKHMLFPAHLSLYEKRATAFTRAAIMQPSLMIYCNILDRISTAEQQRFISVLDEFHLTKTGRTSVYITSMVEQPVQSDFDSIVYIHSQKIAGTVN